MAVTSGSPAARAADVEAAGAVGLVVEHGLAHPDVPVEREGQVDERVLQPLAHPHRHDLDRGGVAVEPAVALGGAGPLLALVAQPLQQRRQPEAVAVGDLVEQLGEVLDVGEVPLAAAPGQHPLGHAGDVRRLEHRGDPARAGVVGPAPQRLGDPVGEVVAGRSRQLGRGAAEEHRGGGGADQAARPGCSNASSRHCQSAAACEANTSVSPV